MLKQRIFGICHYLHLNDPGSLGPEGGLGLEVGDLGK